MNKGFSLVELIVVIAIMAILVGVAVPTYTAYITKANKGVDEDLFYNVERAIETLLVDPDITNPTEAIKISVGEDGALSYTGGSEAFIDKLDDIVPLTNIKLKSDAYKTGMTFSISGYACTWTKVA